MDTYPGVHLVGPGEHENLGSSGVVEQWPGSLDNSQEYLSHRRILVEKPGDVSLAVGPGSLGARASQQLRSNALGVARECVGLYYQAARAAWC